jgi:anti-anti-sigma factor
MHVADDIRATTVTLEAPELQDEVNIRRTARALYQLVYFGRRHLVLDLRNVEFLGSSAALSVFIMLQRKLQEGGGVLVLRNMSRAVYDVFELTRLAEQFDIRPVPPPPAGP